jgi:PAS domain S-box-containing protein
MGKNAILGQNSIIQKMNTEMGLEALFVHATEGILVTNSKGEIIKVNPAAEKLFGYHHADLLGKRIEVLIPARFSKKHETNRDGYHQNPHARSMGKGFDLYGLKQDGSEFPVEISLSPFENENGKFVIAFIVDITERKEAEKKLTNYSQELEQEVEQRTLILSEAIEELERTKEELNISLAQEKELNDLKTRFVSMVSHEFRTPLATILSSLALARKYVELNDNEKQNKHFERIKSSVNNLTDMLNDVLSLSRLEEDKVFINLEPTHLQEFISDMITELSTVCKLGQRMEYKTKHHQAEVEVDKRIIRHILYNLISNAIKFSDDNAIILVHSETSPTQIVLKVVDKGIGISEEDQKHLFESFFRGHNATNIPGTGLGLNIIYRYIQLLNGSIQLESKINIGTTFTVTLPIKTE